MFAVNCLLISSVKTAREIQAKLIISEFSGKCFVQVDGVICYSPEPNAKNQDLPQGTCCNAYLTEFLLTTVL